MSGVTETILRDQLLERRGRLAGALTLEKYADVIDLLQEVDSTLERLDVGEYGLCVDCHVPIEGTRLLADPLVRVCLDCLSEDERHALEHDLETAASIQAALLPEPNLALRGWDIHYRYEPLGPVSGDHVDLIRPQNDSDSLTFLFGDVAGKGVSASILMSHLHALFRSLLPLELPLDELVERANRLFSESTTPSSYATLVVGRTSGNGVVEMVNAGHCPPLVVQNGEISSVLPTGLPLGMFGTSKFRVRRLKLVEDDLLFLYTDGLSEASNAQGEEYGVPRISAVLERVRGLAAAAAAGVCLDELSAYRNGAPRSDDLTIMALRRASLK